MHHSARDLFWNDDFHHFVWVSFPKVKGWKDRLAVKPLAPVMTRPRLSLDPSASPPPTFQQSPLGKSRSIQKKISSGLRQAAPVPLELPETIGEGKEVEAPGSADDVRIPEDAVWIKCYDADTASYYYIKAATGESVWTIPPTEVDCMLCPILLRRLDCWPTCVGLLMVVFCRYDGKVGQVFRLREQPCVFQSCCHM